MSERGMGRAKPVMAPRGKGRRTQAERNQLSTEENARTQDIQIQQQQQDAAERIEREKSARRGLLLERGRGRGGRGGFSGRGASIVGAEPLGPLAAGSIIPSSRTRSFEKSWATSKRGRAGSTTTLSTQKIKRENSELAEPSNRTASSRKSKTSTRVIAEDDEEMIGNEAGEENELPSDIDSDGVLRKDINQIDLISDDEEINEEPAESKRISFLPFRVHRVDHLDRISKITAKAEELELKTKVEDQEVIDVSGSLKRKGKSRVRELESPRNTRRWAGVFPEEELDFMDGTNLSTSPPSSRRQHQQPPEQRRRSREIKIGKRGIRDIPAGWHTQEELDEWKRTLNMMDEVVEVIGKPKPDQTDPDKMEVDDTTVDERNQVYLFQFPAVMPPLVLSSDLTNMEPEEKEQKVSNWMNILGRKSEEARPTPIIDNRPSHLPKAGGKVGKLRVYKSGRTEIDWGGLPFKLKMGIEPAFVQEAVLVKPSGEGGDAYSFGEIEKKFIVVPDLAQFFPKADSEEE